MLTKSELVNDGDNVYYNIMVTNNTNQYQEASFKESRNEIILNNPEDYYLSVIRTYIPLTDIPIFYFLNNTWSVTLVYGAQIQQAYLQYIPDDIANDSSIFNYLNFITCVNNAFSTAYSALTTPPVGSQAPFLTLDYNTGCCSLIVTKTGYTVGFGTDSNIMVYMNSPLYIGYFDSFLSYFNITNNNTQNVNGDDVRLIVIDSGNNTLIVNNPGANANGMYYSTSLFTNTNYYVMAQTFSTLFNWNLLQSLILQSTLPVRNELMPSLNGTGQANYISLLTDFIPSVSSRSAYDFRTIFQYFPTGPYRLLDLLNSDSLRKIDMQIKWQDNNQVIRPVLMAPGSNLSVKLVFIKKDSNIEKHTK